MPVSLTTAGTPYVQYFDALASSGTTGSSLPPEWTFSETGGSAPTTYTVSTGTGTTGDTYSYGIAGTNPVTDRAFGSINSSTVSQVLIGTSFVNNTGATIGSLAFSYVGEQWRNGGNTTQQKLNFQISYNATAINDTGAVWSDIDALDFLGPIATATAGALDGNATANRTAISSTITDLNLANGATFWIRWVDVNDAGNDHGLAIDDFALTASAPAPVTPTLNIDDVTRNEGDAGTVTYTFTVSLSAASASDVTFSIATADGTAQDLNPDTEDSDYVAKILTNQTILAGQTTYTFDVTVNSDDRVEANETFFVNVYEIVGANAGDIQGTGTITNDDAYGALSINDVSLAEGNADFTAFTFTVTRSGGDDGAVSANWTLTAAGGAGQADSSDFAADEVTSGFVEFEDGQTSTTITVNVAGDTVFEADETFTVTLSDPSGGVTIADGSGTGTIQNDDAAPAGTFTIDDVTLAEGNSDSTAFTFTVTRSGGSAGAVGVSYEILAPGGASLADSSDFAADQVYTGTLSFADGETSKTITARVLGDTLFETDEGFAVFLSSATGGATITDTSGTGTITNDDAQPPAGSVSIADAQIVEGNAGTSQLILTLTRSGGTAAFNVEFATANGGRAGYAAATAGSDYVAQSGTVSFGENETEKTVSIAINGDTAFELNEEFTVSLANATAGATIDDGSAIATIQNDDSAPTTLRLLEEDFTGFTAAGFAPNPTAAQIDSDIWRVVGLSDVPTPAYGFTATTGDFARGVIVGNADPTSAGVYSPSADAALVLQPTGGEIENSGYIEARVQNLSGATATGFGVAFDWVYRNSGDRSSNLQLSYSTDGTNFVTVPAANLTTPGTKEAATPSVFTAVNQSLTLSDVQVADQGYLYLRWTHLASAGANNRDEFGIDDVTIDATLAGPPALGVSVSDASVNEAAGTMTFTVTRTSAVSNAFTVDYSTADGTATNGQDYVGTSGMLSFAEHQASATVTVAITDEAIAEFDETVLLELSNPSPGATIVDGQGVGTIVNDDGPPISISISDVTVTEGQSGTTTATFTVTRSGGTGAFDVAYSTADDSAQAGSDYVAKSGVLSFAEGQNSETVSVTVNGDTVSESAETFRVVLSAPTNGALIFDGTGVGTIATDDPIFIHQIQGSSYYSPILAAEGKTAFNVASTTTVIIQAVVTAVDGEGSRQGFYLTEEASQWDTNPMTSEGIFLMTRNDSSVGTILSTAAPGVQVGDIVTFTAQVMEYQVSQSMPKTVLTNMTGFSILSSGNQLPTLTLDAGRPIPNSILTGVTPNYTDSSDDAGDSFDASLYALSYFETVEGMLVTIPDMVVADGFVTTVGAANDPVFQAYSRVHADADQVNSRGGYTVAGDPPLSPPDTSDTDDGTIYGGRHVHDGDTNPDIVELDFSDFATSYPAGQLEKISMGDGLGNVTGIIDFDFTDRKLYVTNIDRAAYQDTVPARETTTFGSDDRSLTVATFNVENLDPTDGAARFAALAGVIANNMNSPDIIIIEEMQDNNGGRENSEPATKGEGDGTSATGTDASLSWQMLIDALNAAVPGAKYQWVDEAPAYNSEGGQPNGNIRVGFLYDTNRVQLGDLAADATIAERRQFTDRIGDTVRDAGDRILFSDDMIAGEINTADWAGTRKSLLGQFTFNGNAVFVAANHFPAKSGSGSFWQLNQNLEAGQPTNSDFNQRNAVAQDLYTMLNLIESGAPGAGVIAGGDYNDFYFYRPLEVATGYVLADGTARSGGARFDNLTVTELTEAERYSYTFDGRSQTLDHVIVNPMLSGVASYDVVHVNTGYSSFGTGANADPSLSDHDPAVASFDFRTLSEVLMGTPNPDVFRLEHGGNDTAYGLGSRDVFYFGGEFTAEDTVDGGDDFDVIVVQGDYPGLTLDGSISNVEGLSLQSGSVTRWGQAGTATNDYVITADNALLAAGVQFRINAQSLTANETFIFDGSQETDGGTFLIYGGYGADVLTGGSGNDIFYFEAGRFGTADDVTGGGGRDAVVISGYGPDPVNPLEVTFASASLSTVEALSFNGRFNSDPSAAPSYEVVLENGNITPGETLIVNASSLGFAQFLDFDGSQVADGKLTIFGGAGADTLRGGLNADVIAGGVGSDVLTGGGGDDIFRYDRFVESNSSRRDSILDFNLGDRIDLSRIDANVFTDEDDAFSFVGQAGFSGQSGELRYQPSGGSVVLVEGDVDGDGYADWQAFVTVTDNHPLTAGDFLL